MRGVMYRTGADGETPLSTPELRISATKNRVAYYDNDTAKQAALSDGDIKEGTIVLTGYEGETEDYATKDTVEELLRKHDYLETTTDLSVSLPYTAPYDGFVTIRAGIDSLVGSVIFAVNGKETFAESTNTGGTCCFNLAVRKGDVVSVATINTYNAPKVIATRFYTQRDYSGRS